MSPRHQTASCTELNLIFIFLFPTDDDRVHPSREFSRYSRIQPRLVHGRHKRSLASTREEVSRIWNQQIVNDYTKVSVCFQNGLHASHLTLTYRLSQTDVILDLQLNEQLVPRGHFLSYQLPNGTGKVVERYSSADRVELCHYRVS